MRLFLPKMIPVLISSLFLFDLCAFMSEAHRQSSQASDGLTSDEKESIQKAKDPEEHLKLYLEIANDRLKTILSFSRKGDAEKTGKAVIGYRTALAGAEDSVAEIQASGKNPRKAFTTLLKATKKYNLSLLEALEKAPEDLRSYLQSAHEISSRVEDGTAMQLEKLEKKK